MKQEPTLNDQSVESIVPASAGAPQIEVPKKRDIWAFLTPVLLSSLVTIAVIAPLFYVLLAHPPKPVAIVDLQRLVAMGQKQYLDRQKATNPGGASEPDVNGATVASAEFARALSAAVVDVGRGCRCVLVNKAAVLNGDTLVDYTDQIRERLLLAKTNTGDRQ